LINIIYNGRCPFCNEKIIGFSRSPKHFISTCPNCTQKYDSRLYLEFSIDSEILVELVIYKKMGAPKSIINYIPNTNGTDWRYKNCEINFDSFEELLENISIIDLYA
jgi:hypothetical protein